MNFRPSFLLLLTFSVLAFRPAAVAFERTMKQSFPVQPGVTVKVDTYRGAIFVEETEEPFVRVEVRVELATEDETKANQSLEALKVEMKTDGNEVQVRARNPRESRALFAWEEKQRVELTFRLVVPRGASVDLATLDGGVTVEDFSGKVSARTRAGTVFCRRIDGSVRAVVDAGDILISRCTGPVDLRVQQGSIRTGTILGRADARSDSGDIEVQSAFGGLNATTSAGDVAVGFQQGFTGDAKIEASGGSVFLKVEPTAAMALEASTSWGRVQTKLPFAIETGGAGKTKFTGKLNGGGPAVQVHAAGGHVKLEASRQFFELGEGS